MLELQKLKKMMIMTLYLKLLAEQEENTDTKVKGDYVKLVGPGSGAYMVDKLSGVIKINKDSLTDKRSVIGITDFIIMEKYMVIDTNIDYEFNCGICDNIHKADLVIANINDDQIYYINSSMVELTEEEN